jgi:hypothetical protein
MHFDLPGSDFSFVYEQGDQIFYFGIILSIANF